MQLRPYQCQKERKRTRGKRAGKTAEAGRDAGDKKVKKVSAEVGKGKKGEHNIMNVQRAAQGR